VQLLKATGWSGAINPIDYSDDDLTPPQETPPSETLPLIHRESGRTAADIHKAMMIEHGPEMYSAALDAEDAEYWKETIGKEVA
jgi:hypothetical protein